MHPIPSISFSICKHVYTSAGHPNFFKVEMAMSIYSESGGRHHVSTDLSLHMYIFIYIHIYREVASPHQLSEWTDAFYSLHLSLLLGLTMPISLNVEVAIPIYLGRGGRRHLFHSFSLCIYIYIYVHICIHVYIYIYIYAYMLPCLSLSRPPQVYAYILGLSIPIYLASAARHHLSECLPVYIYIYI